jgi:undecaprenyl diphosphate synthase
MAELKHIAFIMDGNGRWAKERGKPRNFGHREGVKAMKRAIEAADQAGLQIVTFFAFSTENWKRPKEERDKLFQMIKQFADKELHKYADRNFRSNFMGDISALPEDVKESLKKVTDATAKNSGMIINIAVNYGGRAELVRVFNKLMIQGKQEITSDDIQRELYTANFPDPDVIVRTSGEKRLSNFMLYQAAYSELIFIDDYWPDFNADTLQAIIDEYGRRTRKFGNV